MGLIFKVADDCSNISHHTLDSKTVGCDTSEMQHSNTNISLEQLLRGLDKRLNEGFQGLEKRFKEHERRLNGLEERLNEGFKELGQRLNEHERLQGGLEERLNGLKERLNEGFQGLEQRLDVLEMKKGKTVASKCTVVIGYEIEGKVHYIGHGMLCKDGERKFLLSAAHVLVDLLFDENEHKIAFSFMAGSALKTVLAGFLGLFLPKVYVKEGLSDWGLIEIALPDNLSFSWKDLELTCDSLAKVVGKPRHFVIEGNVLEVLPYGRYSIHCASKPGLSGSPLFDADGKLHSLVHGNSKHRHCSSGSSDELSSTAYADAPFRNEKGSELYRVSVNELIDPRKNDETKTVGKVLKAAESLPEVVAKNLNIKYDEIERKVADENEKESCKFFFESMASLLSMGNVSEASANTLLEEAAKLVLPKMDEVALNLEEIFVAEGFVATETG